MRNTFYILLIVLMNASPGFCQTPKVIPGAMYTSTKSAEAKEYFDNGNKYFDEHNYSKSVECFEHAIAIDNNFIDAYDNVALTFRHAGNLDSAEYYNLASIKKYPKGTVALRNMGVIEIMKKNYGSATDYYHRAIAMNSKDAEAYFGLTRVYSLTDNIPEAIKTGHITEQLYKETNDPNIGDCYMLLAVAYYTSHDKPNAQKYLKLAQGTGMKIDQKYVDIINN